MTETWEITVTPAYGRDYDTADEAFKAWMNDKDFLMMTPGRSGFINKSDAQNYGVPNDTIRLRFNKKSDLIILKYDKKSGTWTRSPSIEEE